MEPDVFGNMVGNLTNTLGQIVAQQQQQNNVLLQQQNATQQAIHSLEGQVHATPLGPAHHAQNSGLTTLAKNIKPPLYSGDKDSVQLDTWLFQLEQYFDTVQPMHDTDKVRAAGLLLKGQAASWLRDMMLRGEVFSSWQNFKDEIVKMFMPIGRAQQARLQLGKAHQRSYSVPDYTTHFHKLGPYHWKWSVGRGTLAPVCSRTSGQHQRACTHARASYL